MRYMRVILTMYEDADEPEQMTIVCANCLSPNVSGVITKDQSKWICNNCGYNEVGLAALDALKLYNERKDSNSIRS